MLMGEFWWFFLLLIRLMVVFGCGLMLFMVIWLGVVVFVDGMMGIRVSGFGSCLGC